MSRLFQINDNCRVAELQGWSERGYRVTMRYIDADLEPSKQSVTTTDGMRTAWSIMTPAGSSRVQAKTWPHLVGQVDDLGALGEAAEVQLPHSQVLEGAVVCPGSHAGLLRRVQRAAEGMDPSAEDALPPVWSWAHQRSIVLVDLL